MPAGFFMPGGDPVKLIVIAALAAACTLAVAADRWVVKAPDAGAPIAPTRIVTSDDPETWPLDYVPARVGAPCDCSRTYAGASETWCVVKGRRMIAAVCEVAK
jgi:hypothetical protein